jgi:alkylation response protein AidB-like acyl-CoA dehydrogenase
VEKDAGGLDVASERLVDSSMAARLTFEGVEVDADAVVGEVDQGWSVLTRLLNAGRAGASAEMVGVAAGAMDMTVDYLKQRTQFGVPIGSFQGLQHRAAHLYSELEIARAAALKAQQLLDEGDPQAELMVSVAKAKAGRTASLAVQEGGSARRQMHEAALHRHDRRAERLSAEEIRLRAGARMKRRRGDISRDDASGTHDGIVADRDAGQDDRAAAYPDIGADRHGSPERTFSRRSWGSRG